MDELEIMVVSEIKLSIDDSHRRTFPLLPFNTSEPLLEPEQTVVVAWRFPPILNESTIKDAF